MDRFRFVFVLAGAGALVAGFSPAVRAQTTTSPIPITQTMSSGIVGVATSQTARLNAYYPGLPAPYATGALCSAQVSFTDDEGKVLATMPITVKPGQSVAVDFVPTAGQLSAANGRLELRASVSVPLPGPVMSGMTTTMPAIAMPVTFCSLSPTLEIFDNDTMKTRVLVADFRLSGFPILAGGVLRGGMPTQ